ncbi:MAG: cob(I)yrinic acid a,c-diamide adenosyltransferase [Chloroflexi bacterium]|nr:cob(I)yrinic acid a,c-diamide adenosyltransferase [Chloroflexota bacterium]
MSKQSAFYTATGDQGLTGLLGKERVPKDHPQPEAIGTLDELSAVLGLAKAFSRTERSRALAGQIQQHLYQIMAEVAATPENADRFRTLDASHVAWLEEQIHQLEADVPAPRVFILPGETQAGAFWALARTVARRAERRVVTLHREGRVQNPALLAYLNRLSSLCFVLELWENQAAGAEAARVQPLSEGKAHDRNVD